MDQNVKDKESMKNIEMAENSFNAKLTPEKANSIEKKNKRRKNKRIKSTDENRNLERPGKMKKEVSIDEVLDFLQELHSYDGSH